MSKLLDLINEREEYLKNIKIDSEDVKYLNAFSPNMADLIKKDFFEVVIAYYMALSETSYYDAKEKLESIINFLTELEDLETIEFLAFVDAFSSIIGLFKDEVEEWTLDGFLNAKILDRKFKKLKKQLKMFRKKFTDEEISNVIKWFCEDKATEALITAIYVRNVKEAKEANTIEEPPAELRFIRSSLLRKVGLKDLEKRNIELIKEANEVYKEELSILREYKDKKIREVTNNKKTINKSLKNLDLLRELLKRDSFSLDELLKLYLDDDILNLALIELIERKNKSFNKNFIRNYNYKENSISKMEKIFNEAGYNFYKLTDEEQKILTTLHSEEKIIENLNFIKTSALSFISESDEAFVKIITLDNDILMQLDSLLIRKKISNDFILKYSFLFDSLKVKVIGNNISKLDAQKVNFENLNDYNDKLIIDLDNRLLEMIVLYGINLDCQNLKCYELLEDPKLLNVVDNYIEMGLISQIQSMPNLINHSDEIVLKRIAVMQLLDEEYINEHDTFNQSVRKGKDFYLSDNDISEYVNVNYNNYLDNDIKELLDSKNNLEVLDELPDEISFIENYKKSNYIYMIGDKYFSRYKVLRCLQTLIDAGYTDYKEIIFQVLIYNYPNYLSIEDIIELKNLDDQTVKKQLN